jgi:5-oxoprolinase (ATP-hydrolysing)
MPRESQKILSLTMVIFIHGYSSSPLYLWCLKIMFLVPAFFSDDQFPSEEDEEVPVDGGDSLVPYASDEHELSLFHDSEEAEEDQTIRADLGGGWGRIIYSPIRRGRQVQMDVCRSTKRDASEGTFERVVVTRSKNPTLHFQARRSLWGDLWPY